MVKMDRIKIHRRQVESYIRYCLRLNGYPVSVKVACNPFPSISVYNGSRRAEGTPLMEPPLTLKTAHPSSNIESYGNLIFSVPYELSIPIKRIKSELDKLEIKKW